MRYPGLEEDDDNVCTACCHLREERLEEECHRKELVQPLARHCDVSGEQFWSEERTLQTVLQQCISVDDPVGANPNVSKDCKREGEARRKVVGGERGEREVRER